MMKAFQHLGSVTESGFLKVWEALDPIVDEMKDFTVEDQELGRLSQWFSQIKYTEDRQCSFLILEVKAERSFAIHQCESGFSRTL